MHLAPEQKTVLFPYTGLGGAVLGMQQAGWAARYGIGVEVLHDRCRTLRANFPEMRVAEARIEDCTLASYGLRLPYVLVVFITCPCQKYTYGADIHQQRTGDYLYLEALRECVLLAPEIMVFEQVEGILAPRFARIRETLEKLRGYHTTRFLVHGHDFSLMRKSRVFYILHRQPFSFKDIRAYARTRPRPRLRDYLDEQLDPFVQASRDYIQTRIAGGYQRKAYIFDPDRDEPIPFLYNYGHDRSAYLVKDERVPGGLRPFSWTEFARLHTIDPTRYTIFGSVTSKYHQIADCVLPAVAEAVGCALNDYFAAVPSLYEPPPHLGYREVLSIEMKREAITPTPGAIHAVPVDLWPVSEIERMQE
jgi:site-specific DNA-cytosine methylase